MSDQIWFLDLSKFMTAKNYNDFFPSKEMTFAEQLNSIFRFSIYFSVLIFLLKKDTNVFFIPIFIAGFTYLIYTIDTQNKSKEKFYLNEKDLDVEKDKLCAKPTPDNPFMNVMMSDYALNPQKKPACDISLGKVKKQIKTHFDQNLYRDVSDIFDKNASDRNYYTMPSTIIPNDRKSYLEFLYGGGKTCKEANGNQCFKNIYRPVRN